MTEASHDAQYVIKFILQRKGTSFYYTLSAFFCFTKTNKLLNIALPWYIAAFIVFISKILREVLGIKFPEF